MTTYRYTAQAGANEAKAVGVGIPVSFKQSYEVANYIRGKSVSMAKKMLEDAMALKRPVPIKRFNKETGHKHGMAAGRFPVNTCTYFLKLLKSAESNAQFKGLSTANLVVKHVAAQQGPLGWRYGRHRRRRAKSTHVEMILREVKNAAKKAERKAKPAAAPAVKPAAAPAAKAAPVPASPKQEAKKPMPAQGTGKSSQPEVAQK